jgi:hypothetical protein|tara:strand:- start:330 stop:530 length:201 start_codon:yes stop_codon:yes gene_type:complete
MAKLTLDEVEYDTDDFNETQGKIVNEIAYNNNLQTQLDYQLQSLRKTGETLVAMLKKELEPKTESE